MYTELAAGFEGRIVLQAQGLSTVCQLVPGSRSGTWRIWWMECQLRCCASTLSDSVMNDADVAVSDAATRACVALNAVAQFKYEVPDARYMSSRVPRERELLLTHY